jgi:hypothetical protein
VFRRKPAEASPTDVPEPQTQGKGRPTPTRKEAEAARKAALVGTVDPKTAKRVSRDADRKARFEAQAALRAGDERALPVRDRGPVKAYVRDAVDGRISLGELFIPVAVAVLVLGFVRVQIVQVILLWVWLFMLIGVVVDSLFIVWRLRGGLRTAFPDADPAIGGSRDERGHEVYGTKGAALYGVIRSLQIRKLRLPPPKVRWNGQPRTPKAPKPAATTKA